MNTITMLIRHEDLSITEQKFFGLPRMLFPEQWQKLAVTLVLANDWHSKPVQVILNTRVGAKEKEFVSFLM